MIRAKSFGNFDNIRNFAKRVTGREMFNNLDAYGRRGVEALAAATPIDSGLSALSWSYRIFMKGKRVSIEWFNSNDDATGTPIVILLQYGHATGTGGYVQGKDFINPAMQPVFDEIQADVWKVVRS
jgi:hypothetical protein